MKSARVLSDLSASVCPSGIFTPKLFSTHRTISSTSSESSPSPEPIRAMSSPMSRGSYGMSRASMSFSFSRSETSLLRDRFC